MSKLQRIVVDGTSQSEDPLDVLRAYGPHKTLYNPGKRWSEAGVFTRMMEGLAAADGEPRTVMTDATFLKAHRTASSLRVEKGISGA